MLEFREALDEYRLVDRSAQCTADEGGARRAETRDGLIGAAFFCDLQRLFAWRHQILVILALSPTVTQCFYFERALEPSSRRRCSSSRICSASAFLRAISSSMIFSHSLEVLVPVIRSFPPAA